MKSIGRHGSPWTPDTARNEALRLLGTLVGGGDPFAKPLTSKGFGAEVERYLERKRAGMRPRSFGEIKRFLTNHFAPLAKLRLTDIDRRTIALVLAEIERHRGPVARNRAPKFLASLWCCRRQNSWNCVRPPNIKIINPPLAPSAYRRVRALGRLR